MKVLSKFKKCQITQEEKMKKSIEEIKTMLKENGHGIPKGQLQKLISTADLKELSSMLRNNQISSVQLLLHYLQRCITVGVKLNAIADFNHAEAMKMAKLCDNRLLSNQSNEGLPELYGIPVSVKLNFVQKGFDTSLCLSKYYGDIHEEDGQLLRVLKKAGAIPFLRSVIPAGGLGTGCINYIYGTVDNPYNPDRSSGGSSGGEATLLASGCSPLGFGTDSAGSMRTPAHFCGVVGYMVSPSKIPCKGNMKLEYDPKLKTEATEWIMDYLGIMARSARDVQYTVSCIEKTQKIMNISIGEVKDPFSDDSNSHHYEVRSDTTSLQKTKVIGVIDTSILYTPTKPQKRALEIARGRLEKKGYTLVDFNISEVQEVCQSFIAIAFQTIPIFGEIFKGEIVGGEGFSTKLLNFFPYWIIPIVKKYLKSCGGQKYTRVNIQLKLAEIMNPLKTTKLLESHHKIIDEVRTKMNEQNIGALLTIGLPPAYLHNQSTNLTVFHSIHNFANSLKFCAGAIPITTSLKEDHEYKCEFNDMYTPYIKENLEGIEGLPVGVQIAAPLGMDELCLRIMEDCQTYPIDIVPNF